MPQTPEQIIRDSQPAQECYRCGYDLRGTADDRPCPECGLLAERSRRETDELRHTRPLWLRRLARGSALLLTAIVIVGIWPMLIVPLYQPLVRWLMELQLLTSPFGVESWLPLLGFDVAAVLILAGAILLTTREGYAPADQADRARRRSLRVAACAPLLAMLLFHLYFELRMRLGWNYPGQDLILTIGIATATFGCAALPMLGFLHLRSLAQRARSAHLAEHCAIVGVGAAGALVYVGVVVFLFRYAVRLGLGSAWANSSSAALALPLVAGVAAGLFTLWSLYLLLRFAIAFRRAYRELDHQWWRDDRNTGAGGITA